MIEMHGRIENRPRGLYRWCAHLTAVPEPGGVLQRRKYLGCLESPGTNSLNGCLSTLRRTAGRLNVTLVSIDLAIYEYDGDEKRVRCLEMRSLWSRKKKRPTVASHR